MWIDFIVFSQYIYIYISLQPICLISSTPFPSSSFSWNPPIIQSFEVVQRSCDLMKSPLYPDPSPFSLACDFVLFCLIHFIDIWTPPPNDDDHQNVIFCFFSLEN